MDSREAILSSIIPKIRAYMRDPNTATKSYADFIADNKAIFVVNLYNVDAITDDDIRLLFATMEQNPDADDATLISIFSYIGYKFEKQVRDDATASLSVGERIADDTKHSMYEMFFNTFDMVVRQRRVNVLVHDDATAEAVVVNRTSDLRTSFDDSSDPAVREIPFNMRNLLQYVSKNLDRIRFSKKYLEFAYLCRHIGIPVSRRKLNLRYVFMYDLDGVRIPIVIRDFLDVKKVFLEATGKVYLNNFADDHPGVAEWGRAFVERMAGDERRLLFKYVFLSSRQLCDLFPALVGARDSKFRQVARTALAVREPPGWREEVRYESPPCEHQIKLAVAMRVDVDYFTKVNEFVEEFVYFEDGLAYCNICGMNIPDLNTDASGARAGVVAPATNKSIFLSEPYSYFSHSQRFIFNIVMSFDTIMKTQTWGMKYNINRLILNFLIAINARRQEYERRFAAEIKRGVFFLRLSANLLDVHASATELFQSAKTLNLNFIVSLVIVLNSSADFLVSFMAARAARQKDGGDADVVTERTLRLAIAAVVHHFLVKTRVCAKEDLDTIVLLTEVYTSIMPEELEAHYHRLVAELHRLNTIGRTTRARNYLVESYADATEARAIEFFASQNVGARSMRAPPRERPVACACAAVADPRPPPRSSPEAREAFAELTADTRVLIRVHDTNAYNMKRFDDHIKIEIEKKKVVISLASLFVTNTMKYYYANAAMYVFRFSDPYPFDEELLGAEHVAQKVNGYNHFRRHFFPDSDVFVYFSDSLDRAELEFAFFLFLSGLVDSVKDWIDGSIAAIKELYMINFNT
ncbi:putative RNA polymerase-associated protein RAP94 [Parapoxvirus red deer/HL953]|uniref:RNA polymerase-associated transcription-specificity factor RAP94 n=1 Tax=Parapoxvirus red deer/HL953 TaxID=1579460 RepID=A0A0A7MES8_9POXV|nr:putative RNA polymerase-associated protein RAP94 [Parapoxvirus red deer/HL953]AIZ77311.1 putative RNA polymerase-associated protein RAP94 [Parapoxvirus red deer/HL953]